MTYILEVRSCEDSDCRLMTSKRNGEVTQEFHVPASSIDEAIAEWKKMFTGEEFESKIAQIVRHDIN